MHQDELLLFAAKMLEELSVPYMLVGSIASSIYGEPRSTLDIDIVIKPTSEQLERICEQFPSADFYVSREAARQALSTHGQFNVLDPSSGNKIDFMIARPDAWGEAQMGRRQKLQLTPGHEGFAARPEDLILSKMLYYQEGGSEKHLRDIAGILKISGTQIDRDYIRSLSQRLDLLDIWNAILARLNDSQK